MKKSRYFYLTLVVCLFWMATDQVKAYEFEVGQVFPNLVLPSLEDGRPGSIAEFRGQKLILHIWASW